MSKECHWCKTSTTDKEIGERICGVVVCIPCIEKQKAEFQKVYEKLADDERAIREQNDKLLSQISKYAKKHLKTLLYGCDLSTHEPLTVVDKPQGENQNQKAGCFKKVYVQQWSTSMEGDSFAGYIYAEYDKKLWLKIPFNC